MTFGDRFGVIDSNGEMITPNQLVALLTDYLTESRGWTQGVTRSVATSHLVDKIAENRGLKFHETPVGFKFIFDDGSWMLMRPSGTEPLVRIYAESEDKADLEVLLEQGRHYLLD